MSAGNHPNSLNTTLNDSLIKKKLLSMLNNSRALTFFIYKSILSFYMITTLIYKIKITNYGNALQLNGVLFY